MILIAHSCSLSKECAADACAQGKLYTELVIDDCRLKIWISDCAASEDEARALQADSNERSARGGAGA
jgi:hypothetical protein